MSQEPRERNKFSLAVALARGSSIRRWARANNVPRETARRWAHEPDVRLMIETVRRRAIDRAVGELAGRSSWAAGRICKLARAAESESVQLGALKSILSDMIAVSNYSGLEERLDGLEAHVRAQAGQGKPQLPSVSLLPPMLAGDHEACSQVEPGRAGRRRSRRSDQR
jgi:hypothetical protein